MAKFVPANTGSAIDKVLGERVENPFSATRIIGGKLRSLYSEAEEQDEVGLSKLLRALQGERPTE
jgi:hypothetical protein